MFTCSKCYKPFLEGQRVRVIANCYFMNASLDGYGLEFLEQEYLEHFECKRTPFLRSLWTDLKFKWITRKVFK